MGDVRGGGGHRRDVPGLLQGNIALVETTGATLLVTGVADKIIAVYSFHLSSKDSDNLLELRSNTTPKQSHKFEELWAFVLGPGDVQGPVMFCEEGESFYIYNDKETDLYGGYTYRLIEPENL